MDCSCYFGNPNDPNPNYGVDTEVVTSSPSEYMLLDSLMFEDVAEDHHHHLEEYWSHQGTESSEKANNNTDQFSTGATSSESYNNIIECEEGLIKGNSEAASEVTQRIAFRTRSELDVMDDGYKWRKYGKKSVKSNPNPRNYYKCASEGCKVKKIVERDREDVSYVITTYDGIHTHESPSSAYHSQMLLPNYNYLHPSTSANSSSTATTS